MRYLLFIFICSSFLFSETKYEDVVYLKDGSEIHGMIIEQKPNVYIKIKSGDNIFVFEMNEIEKMVKEEIDSEKDRLEETSKKSNRPWFKKTKKGETESWYVLTSGGYLDRNIWDKSNQNLFEDIGYWNTDNTTYTIGVYKHTKYLPESIIGIVYGIAESWYEANTWEWLDNKYSYDVQFGGISLITYSNEYIPFLSNKFGSGLFIKCNILIGKSEIWSDYDVEYVDFIDNGYGFTLGAGYTYDFGGLRMGLNFDWSRLSIARSGDTNGTNYLSSNLSIIF